MLTAEIITIGNELLNGKLNDTNSSMIASMLDKVDIHVKRKTTVGDDEAQIINIIQDNKESYNIRIFSGGLGPTHDDKTKDAVCKAFKSRLVMNKDVYANIIRLFSERNVMVTPTNEAQAMVPNNAGILMNEIGTAPGLTFVRKNTIYVFLPAVPFELKHLMINKVMPLLLQTNSDDTHVHYCDFIFSGIGESFLYDLLKKETDFFDKNFDLAFLPSPGIIKFRQKIRSQSDSVAASIFDETEKQIEKVAAQFYVGRDVDNPASVLQKIFIQNNLTLSVAESCTGGNIGHLITSVSGSSGWFVGGVIAYSNDVKINQLGVDKLVIDDHGAVSEAVVKSMAEKVRNLTRSNYSIAVSGIAGPEGGTPDKPIGTVWIAVADKKTVKAKLFNFGVSDRNATIQRASVAALVMLLQWVKDRM